MSAFLEQYGISIFVLVVIGIMVLVASPLGLKVEDLVEKEIQQFSDTAGKESWDSESNKDNNTAIDGNNYGFYFDKVYASYYQDGIRWCYIFRENGTVECYAEINKYYYDTFYYDINRDLGLEPYDTTIEEAETALNERELGSETGTTFNATYDNLYVEDENGLSLYFSNNGTTIYADNEKTEFEAELVNENQAYAIFSETDNSFTFVRSTTEPVVGEMFNGKIVTKVFGDFETSYDVVPWFYSLNSYGGYFYAEKVIFETEIQPLNCQYFFALMGGCGEFDVRKLDISRVENMYGMFSGAGSDEQFKVIGLENWDVSNVTTMEEMFYSSGYDSEIWDVGDLSNWDVSNVTSMFRMFAYAGCDNADKFDIGNLSTWDVSNVKDMKYLFYYAGKNATTWNVGDLSNWDTSSVTDMYGMFGSAGYNANEWNIGDLSRKEVTVNGKTYTAWDTSKVTDMTYMFAQAGYKPNYYLDLSSWDVSKVTAKRGFDDDTGNKITSPWGR